MPMAMNMLSASRAVTYPRARISFSRLRIGNSTTAEPILATIRMSSQTAPNRNAYRRRRRR